MVLVVPAFVTEITPAHEHIHLDVLFKAGNLRNVTVGEPGVHGVVTGTHGMGVSTPLAAAVAEATVGFASEVQVANGGILVTGAKSIILAAGFFSPVTNGTATMKVEGADPKVHCKDADITTSCAMMNSLSN